MGLEGANEILGAQGEASTEAQAESLASLSTYFIVTRQDFRKCAWPLCGGVYVKRVNRKKTLCADGTLAEECYITETNLKTIGLDSDSAYAFTSTFNAGHALVRGHIVEVDDPNVAFPIPTLVGSEAWAGVTEVDDPAGKFRRVDSTGLECVTYPCPVFHEAFLNHFFQRDIAEVDLANSGATNAQVADGFAELDESGLLVVGTKYSVSGPGGTMPAVSANEFYSRVVPKAGGESCGINVCGDGLVCCNASCGWCVPPDIQCIQIACDPVE